MTELFFNFQNRTGEGHFDVSCGSDCSVQQVSKEIYIYLQ